MLQRSNVILPASSSNYFEASGSVKLPLSCKTVGENGTLCTMTTANITVPMSNIISSLNSTDVPSTFGITR